MSASAPAAARGTTDSAAGARSRRRLTDSKWVQRAIVWTALLAIYQVLAIVAGEFYAPRLEQIVGGFFDLVEKGRIPILLDSLGQLAVGFAIAAAVGIPVGLAMGRSRIVEYTIGMYVKGLFVTSLVALVPLLIIFFGIGFTFRVAVVFLFAVFFIVVNAAAGGRNADRRLLRTAEAFGAGRVRTFVSVVLPGALPFVMVGLRLGLANAFSGMILSELWISRGTGAVLEGLGRNRNLPEFFAFILLITAVAGLLAWLLKWLERRLMPWSEDVMPHAQ